MTKAEVAIKSALRGLLTVGAFAGTQAAVATLLHGLWQQLVAGLVAILVKGVSAWLTARNVSLTVLP